MNKFFAVLALIAMVNAGPELEKFLGPLTVGAVCDAKAVYQYTVTDFSMSPYPPTKGGKLSIKSTGTFTSDQTVVSAVSEVYWSGYKLSGNTIPQNQSFKAGQVGVFTSDQDFPAAAPSGNYDIIISLINSQNAQISCWKVSFYLA